MTILDTEPMDGVDNANGLIGYITFVSELRLEVTMIN